MRRGADPEVLDGLVVLLAAQGQVAQVDLGPDEARVGGLLVAVLGHVDVRSHACSGLKLVNVSV